MKDKFNNNIAEKVTVENNYFQLEFYNNIKSPSSYFYKNFGDYIRFGLFSNYYNYKHNDPLYSYNDASSWAYKQLSLALSSNKGLLQSLFLANHKLFQPGVLSIRQPKAKVRIFDYNIENKELTGAFNGSSNCYYKDNEENKFIRLDYSHLTKKGWDLVDKINSNEIDKAELVNHKENYTYPCIGQFSETNSYVVNLNTSELLLINRSIKDFTNIKKIGMNNTLLHIKFHNSESNNLESDNSAS